MFENNLQYLGNDSLKKRLEAINIEDSRKDMSYCMTKSNDYLLMKNDVPLDDIDNPRAAVQSMLKESIKNPMLPNDIIITFGIGLCYQLDEVFNTYPSRIFIYEPDINLLHFVLNNVDITDHLKSGRVFIFDNLDELTQKLSSIYITKDKVEVIYLKNYAIVKSQDMLQLSQKVFETCRSKTVDVNTITRYSRYWLQNSLQNINSINSKTVYQISDLDGKFLGEAALIVGAGPSLIENIQFIKNNREKYVIFAVNKALKILAENNIIPDFAVCADARFVEKTLSLPDEYLQKINCIMLLNTDSSVINKNFKRTFISFSSNDGIVKRLSEYNKFIKTRETGGSATTAAFVNAVKMGFSRIILTGVDLAFKDSAVYSTGETYEAVTSNKVKINNITKNLTKVPSVNGNDVVTSEDYAAFIQHMETLIKDMEFSEIYNTTSFGAKIEGVKNMPFDKIPLFSVSNTTAIVLGEAKPFKLDIKDWTQDELLLINNIITYLSKGTFSPALVSSITKSQLMYQYMQADILQVLQSGMDDSLAEGFINRTKEGIKYIVDVLQKNQLI